MTSASQPTLVALQHSYLAVTVDFERRVLEGYALHEFAARDTLESVVLDVGENVLIHRIVAMNGIQLSFETEPARYGRALRVQLFEPISAGEATQIRIFFSTDPDAAALNWHNEPQCLLVNNGTVGARSWFPCFDAPSMICGYTVEINAPKETLVLCAALLQNTSTLKTGLQRFKFSAEMPIAAHQLGLVVVSGLEQLDVTDCPAMLYYTADSSASVIVDLDAALESVALAQMFERYRKSIGDYPWSKYDIVVLPTQLLRRALHYPSLLLLPDSALSVRDGQLTNTDLLNRFLALDLATSWFSDTIAPASWSHSWVGSALATLMARRYRTAIGGESRSFVEHTLGMVAMSRALDALDAVGHGSTAFTRLVAELEGDAAPHPDLLLATRFHAEKGYCFLRYLELHAVADPIAFALWLKRAAAALCFKAVDSKLFVEFFVNYFINQDTPGELRQQPNKIPWQRWLATPGLPLDFEMPELSEGTVKTFSELEERAASWQLSEDAISDLSGNAETVLLLEMLSQRFRDEIDGQLPKLDNLAIIDNQLMADLTQGSGPE